MAATMATSATCMSLNPSPPKSPNQTKPISSSKPFITLPTPPKPTVSLAVTSTALAGAVFSTLSYSEPAFAAHQIAELAAAAAGGSDNRGLALLLPIVPAIGWVLFNILQPALNQINKMRESKGVVAGLGIGGGLAASGLLTMPPEASASVVNQMAAVAEAAAKGEDNRGQLLLFVVAPALLWVLYNILQPALNQLNKMRSE
ncbi:hypothetical protein BRARA_G02560 [Brassica rapa]|uniref:Photosystem II core complex proteins psbY, chloroplastic n=1 Tax=Brassica campestris TaxID=3711 RepID=A0A397YPE4_BRACM|nr:photosystem II core complex proteins psbY, chloroplastic [Brassica napus]RID55292.1 hypothetical protein BRARA_G02560 [Brassica rapa]